MKSLTLDPSPRPDGTEVSRSAPGEVVVPVDAVPGGAAAVVVPAQVSPAALQEGRGGDSGPMFNPPTMGDGQGQSMLHAVCALYDPGYATSSPAMRDELAGKMEMALGWLWNAMHETGLE